MSKNTDQHVPDSVLDENNDEIKWEVKPDRMLVQKQDDDVGNDSSATTQGPMIKLMVSYPHGPSRHEVHVPAQSTFGKSSTHSSACSITNAVHNYNYYDGYLINKN